MNRFKTGVYKILMPSIVWRILLTILSGAALIYAFLKHLSDSPTTYAVYALSAYTLTILVVGMPDTVRKGRAMLYKNRYSRRFMTELPFRIRTSLLFSLLLNLAFSVFKMAAGILYASVWFGAIAVYNMVLCVVRFLLLLHMGRDQGSHKAYREYRFCGWLLFLLNIALTVIVIQMIYSNKGYQYSGYLIYVMAAYAFYSLTSTIQCLVRYRRLMSPAVSASKMINLVTALVAMLSLQTAMFSEFGEGNTALQQSMNAITGGCVCIGIFAIGIYMIGKANRALNGTDRKEG